MIVNYRDRITSTVEMVLDKIIPEHEYVEWDVALTTEPTPEQQEDGLVIFKYDQFVSFWLTVKEEEEDLNLMMKARLPLSIASDENMEALVRECWDAILLERMETQFSK